MLRILNAEVGYGKLKVIKQISLHVEKQEIVTIIGGNGAGKTTLLHTIAGIVRPWEGRFTFDSVSIEKPDPVSLVSLGCSLVPEGRQVFAPLTVKDNLVLGAYQRWKKGEKDEVNKTLEYVYGLFPRLKERERQLAGTLSGGEQQMLAIGRALMSKPRFLMMDEPSMGIAPLIVKDIFQTILSLRDEGLTVLLVEQNAKAALKIADRGYVLETGQMVLDGTSEDLLNNHDVQRAYLGKEYRRIDE